MIVKPQDQRNSLQCAWFTLICLLLVKTNIELHDASELKLYLTNHAIKVKIQEKFTLPIPDFFPFYLNDRFQLQSDHKFPKFARHVDLFANFFFFFWLSSPSLSTITSGQVSKFADRLENFISKRIYIKYFSLKSSQLIKVSTPISP